jgi:hypothetical protein
VIDSSIDFESADKAYRSLATDDSHLTPAWILSHLYEGHANLVAAAEVASEIGADPLEAALARAQVEACIARANTGTEKLRSFQEVLLEARSVGDAVASGQRNFDELRQLIEAADKFRTWIRNREPDSELLKEYAKACSSVSWAESLPNKTRRFFLFNAIGTGLSFTLDPLTGAAAGLGLNAIDTFLFENSYLAGSRANLLLGRCHRSFRQRRSTAHRSRRDLPIMRLFAIVPAPTALNGTWTNTGTNQSPVPAVISLSPASGSGSNSTFTGLFSHTGGTSQIYLAYVLFLPIPNVVQYTAKGSCLVEYNRISNGVRLINDAGDDWLGPISGVPVSPSATPLSNSLCTVNVRGVSVAASGSSIAVSVPVTFAPGFSGGRLHFSNQKT